MTDSARTGVFAADGASAPSAALAVLRVSRWCVAALLAWSLLAAGALVLGARGAALRDRLLGLVVVPGADPSGAPNPGDLDPFEPFSFGVVPPVRGDAAMLARSVEGLAAAGARFVVICGDVTADGSDAEAVRLAAAFRERGVHVVAVPGQGDLRAVRRESFASTICAPA